MGSLALQFRFLILMVCIFSYPAEAHGDITADALLILPNDVIIDEIGSGTNEALVIREKLPNLYFQEPFRSWIKGIRFNADGKLSLSHPNDGTNGASSKPLNSLFQIALNRVFIDIEQIRTRDVQTERRGFNEISVTIEGECTNASVEYKGSPSIVEGEIEVVQSNSRLALQLVDFNWSGFSNHWNVDLGECNGPRGYDVKVREEIIKYLNNGEMIRQELLKAIQAELNKKTDQLNTELFKLMAFPFVDGQELLWQSKEVTMQSNAMLIKGDLRFASKKQLHYLLDQLPSLEDLEEVQNAQLHLPTDMIGQLVSVGAQNFIEGTQIHAHDIEDLGFILKYRFIQFFVWPDLMRHPRNTNFLFRSHLAEEVVVQPHSKGKSVGPYPQGREVVFDMSASLKVDMLFPQGNEYVNITGPVGGQVKLNVTQGRFGVYFKTTQADLNYNFSPDYLLNNKPWGGIPIRMISSSLVEHFSFSSDSEPVSLPLYRHDIPLTTIIQKDNTVILEFSPAAG